MLYTSKTVTSLHNSLVPDCFVAIAEQYIRIKLTANVWSCDALPWAIQYRTSFDGKGAKIRLSVRAAHRMQNLDWCFECCWYVLYYFISCWWWWLLCSCILNRLIPQPWTRLLANTVWTFAKYWFFLTADQKYQVISFPATLLNADIVIGLNLHIAGLIRFSKNSINFCPVTWRIDESGPTFKAK